MDTHNKTFHSKNKWGNSSLTATPARDIIIANTRRVSCGVCGAAIGGAIPGCDVSGSLYYCRKCKGFRRVVNTVSEP